MYILPPELYPSPLRSTGVGLAMGPGRVGALLAAAIGPVIYESDSELVFHLNGLAFFFGALMVLFIPYETRARPLQDTVNDAEGPSPHGDTDDRREMSMAAALVRKLSPKKSV